MNHCVKPLEKVDYDKLADFLAESTGGKFSANFWQERFTYFWDKNPAMEGFARGWVLWADDKIKGFFGNIPVKYTVDNREVTFFAATTWYVADDCRGKSLNLIRNFLKQSGPFFDTTPIPNVAKIIAKLEFRELMQTWISKDALYILNFSQFSRMMAARRANFFVKSAIFVGINFVGALLNFFCAIKKALFSYRNLGVYDVRKINGFDERYDRLWGRIKKKYKICAKRNAQALNWFFFAVEDLSFTRRVFEVNKDGNLIGYFAFKVIERCIQGSKIINWELVDMVIDSDDVLAYSAAIKNIKSAAKKERVCFIQMNAFDENARKAMHKFDFIWVNGRHRFFYRGFDAQVSRDFYATALDGDRPFFP
jgi:hypothetical protein